MSTPHRQLAAICAGLWFVSVLLYARSIGFGLLHYDDTAILLGQPELFDHSSWGAGIRAIVLENFPREEPLLVRDLSWLVDARLFGFDNPAGYHLGNVLWNANTVVLLAWWLWRLQRDLWIAGVGASLFALLPIHVEPVCWAMGRKDLLCASLCLAVLIAHSYFVERSDSRRWFAYAIALTLYPAAIMAKFSAVILCGVMALQHALWPHVRGEVAARAPLPLARCLRAGLTLLPHVVISLVIYRWYAWNLSEMGVTVGRGPAALSAVHLSTLATFLPWVLVTYARNLVFAGEHSIFYLRPNADLPMGTGEVLGAAAIWLVVAAAVFQCWRRRRDLFFFVAAFFVLMVPYLNIVYIGIWVADRYVYLASGLLLALLTVWGRERLTASPSVMLRRAVAALLVMLGLSWATTSFRRAAVFESDSTLWRYESGLSAPTVLALQADAKAQLRAVASSPNPTEALARAEQAIARGLAYYESLPWRREHIYRVQAHLYYSKLLQFHADVAGFHGAGPAQRLRDLLRAHTVAPRSTSARLVADAYWELAIGSPDSAAGGRAARESLHYFDEYILYSKGSPEKIRELLLELRHRYQARFPQLEAAIDAVAARHAP